MDTATIDLDNSLALCRLILAESDYAKTVREAWIADAFDKVQGFLSEGLSINEAKRQATRQVIQRLARENYSTSCRIEATVLGELVNEQIETGQVVLADGSTVVLPLFL